MKFRIYILAFCVAVFFLTAIGLTALYTRLYQVQILWLAFAYVIAIFCMYAFLVQPLLAGERKLSGKKMGLLTFSMIMIGGVVTHSVWTIITPKWSFSVTADKSTYILGEYVKITVSLKNLGFITHSFESAVSDPVVVSIEGNYQVWYNPFHRSITEFSVRPKESLERNFIWNQTKSLNIQFGEKIEPGIYYIEAFIPSVNSGYIRSNLLFRAAASINITSP